MKFPALAIAASFALGILAGGRFALTQQHTPAIALAVAATLLITGFTLRKYTIPASIAALVAWCALGAAAGRLEGLAVPANRVTRLVAEGQLDLSEPLRWQGRLRSDPLRLPWGIRYDVDLEQVESKGNAVSVSGGLRADYFFDERSRQDPPVLRAGDRLKLLLRARPVRNFADPGVTDHRALMAYQGIYITGSPRNTTLITKIPGPAPTLAQRLARLRGDLLNEADAMFAGWPDRAAVLRAMLLGDRSFLDSQQVEAFRDTGVYHVLVLAGLHVGILAAALLWIGRKLRLPVGARTYLTLAALACYVGVVEDRPPIVRAALMAAAYLLARILFRRTHPLNAVGIAALLILLFRPSELADASFLLSFLAALLICGIAAPWLARTTEPYLRALDHLGDVTRDGAFLPRVAQFRLDARAAADWLSGRLPGSASRQAQAIVAVPCRAVLRVWELVVISAVLQIGMIPAMAQYFHLVSLAAFGANFPAVLLTGIIVPLGFFVLGAGSIANPLGHLAASALSNLVGLLLWVVDSFAQLPRASFRIPSPPLVVTVAFFAAAVLCAVAVLTGTRWAYRITGAVVLVIALLIAIHPFAPSLNRGRLEVTVLDVGQGDSIFVAFPDGHTMLVDGGGLPGGAYIHGSRPGIDVGEDVVSPYLWSRGLKRIDVVALTHGHEDHYGGLASVLRNFKVGEVWVGHDPQSAAGYRALLAEVHALQLPLVHRVRGDSFDWGGVHVSFLWPADDSPVKTASNNDSLVMRLEDGSETMLLTGDIETPVERTLTADGDTLSADFLKVPHHGSKTSSTQGLLDAVRPRFAVISVGEDNTFGQPNSEVLDRIEQEGARLYRTDRDGAVTALTDGNQLSVNSFLEQPYPDGGSVSSSSLR
jgi:competence protein ComEC